MVLSYDLQDTMMNSLYYKSLHNKYMVLSYDHVTYTIDVSHSAISLSAFIMFPNLRTLDQD